MNKSKKPQPNVDGVVQRQRRRQVGDFKDTRPLSVNRRFAVVDKNRADGFTPAQTEGEKTPEREGDVSMLDSLEIANEANQPSNPNTDDVSTHLSPRRQRRLTRKMKRDAKKARRTKFSRIFRRSLKFSSIAVIVVIGFIAFTSWSALSNIIVDRDGGGAPALAENIDITQLKGEGDGRINIMMIGIGGAGHEGGNLADTIIIASIDPVLNSLSMLSVPRDFYVDIPDYGSSRINAAHSYGEDSELAGGGVELTKKTLESVLDIPIHYFVRVDFKGFIQAVDAVGGIELDVKEALYDTNFWWQYGVLDIQPGLQPFDGEKALYYARSRYTSSRGDFSRNERQREMLLALKDKVFSLGTFTNPLKINGLVESAGNHARTDIQVSEMLRLYEIIQEIPSASIISEGLDNGPENYLSSANINGASVLVPNAGQGVYSEIQRYVRGLFVDGLLKKENSKVDVLNGSGAEGVATEVADELKSYGYRISRVRNAPTDDYVGTTIYDLSSGQSPFTKQYLEQRYNVTMKDGSELPEEVKQTSQFIIILGSDAQDSETTT